eukprot:IDg10085t1
METSLLAGRSTLKYVSVFAPVHIDKFRRRFHKLLDEKTIKLHRGKMGLDDEDELGDFDTEGDVSDEMADADTKEPSGSEKSTPMLEFKPLYNISTWKHPRTRDGRVTIILQLAAGSVEQPNDVHAEVVNGWIVRVDMMWPPVLSESIYSQR